MRMLLGHLFGDMYSTAEFLDRVDDVICGRHNQGRVGIPPLDEDGAKTDARGGVSAAGLTDNMILRKSWKLFRGLFAVGAGGDDPKVGGGHLSFKAVVGLLQKATVAGQCQKLLRPLLPAARPEARAAAPRHDHRVKHIYALPGRLGK